MEIVASILLLLLMFGLPFSKHIRIKMFARDKATCQSCGRKWEDGWMLHAAHINHKRNRWYNKLSNGKMLCIDCHIEQHKRFLKKARTKKERNMHAYAVRKLSKLDRRNIHFQKKPPQ